MAREASFQENVLDPFGGFGVAVPPLDHRLISGDWYIAPGKLSMKPHEARSNVFKDIPTVYKYMYGCMDISGFIHSHPIFILVKTCCKILEMDGNGRCLLSYRCSSVNLC